MKRPAEHAALTLLCAVLGLVCGSCGNVTPRTPPDGGQDAGTNDGGEIADAPPDAAMCSTSIDLTSDPNNCGACGHSCNGGTCQASACQPVALAIAQGTPNEITVDASNVYWTTADGNVLKVPIDGLPALSS